MNNNVDMEENKKIREMINNSRKLIKEEWYEDDDDELTEEEVKILAKELKKFNKYGDALFPDEDQDLIVLAKKLAKLSEFAQKYLNQNVDDEFDRVTINRNINELNSYIEDFIDLAQEVKEKQERLAALYEDIGVVFNRYFEVGDREEVDLEKGNNQGSQQNEWINP